MMPGQAPPGMINYPGGGQGPLSSPMGMMAQLAQLRGAQAPAPSPMDGLKAKLMELAAKKHGRGPKK